MTRGKAAYFGKIHPLPLRRAMTTRASSAKASETPQFHNQAGPRWPEPLGSTRAPPTPFTHPYTHSLPDLLWRTRLACIYIVPVRHLDGNTCSCWELDPQRDLRVPCTFLLPKSKTYSGYHACHGAHRPTLCCPSQPSWEGFGPRGWSKLPIWPIMVISNCGLRLESKSQKGWFLNLGTWWLDHP